MKMHWMRRLIVSVLLCSFMAHAMAESSLPTADSFAVLHERVVELSPEAIKRTLIVMDDDDTLMMMPCPDSKAFEGCQYLGGPAWDSWQTSLFTKNSAFKVANNRDQLIEISALLLSVTNVDYTEKELPDLLEQLTGAGAKLLVLTDRGPNNVSATARQFKYHTLSGGKYAHFLDLIQQNALLGKDSAKTNIASPFYCATGSRPVSYQQGVMYGAGQNKGDMLHCLLELTQSETIEHIFFIDDILQNVIDVHQAFSGNNPYQMHVMHYTRLREHKAALTEGPHAAQLQQNAHQRWQAIKNTLEQNLLAPAVPTADQ